MTLEESDSSLSLGDPAPAFDLPGADGEAHDLDSFTDRAALLVVFTCNHCPYAKAKVGELNDLAATYDDLAVVGINPNDADEKPEDSFERMRELVADGTVAYDAYLRDATGTIARRYGAVCTPDPFLFGGADGAFRLAYHGRIDDALNPDDEPARCYVREAVEAVLAGDPVPFADEDLPSQGCSIKWPE